MVALGGMMAVPGEALTPDLPCSETVLAGVSGERPAETPGVERKRLTAIFVAGLEVERGSRPSPSRRFSP
jgi:hypothetical protein